MTFKFAPFVLSALCSLPALAIEPEMAFINLSDKPCLLEKEVGATGKCTCNFSFVIIQGPDKGIQILERRSDAAQSFTIPAKGMARLVFANLPENAGPRAEFLLFANPRTIPDCQVTVTTRLVNHEDSGLTRVEHGWLKPEGGHDPSVRLSISDVSVGRYLILHAAPGAAGAAAGAATERKSAKS